MNYEVIATGPIQLQLKENFVNDAIVRYADVIEDLWRDAKRNNEGLFNAPLLNLHTVNNDQGQAHVLCYFVEYKDFMAQRARPDLNLGIKPIGVSGFVLLEDEDDIYTVLAQRKHVTDYSGFLELVPSGSINKESMINANEIDYQESLRLELFEETGFLKMKNVVIEPFAFILDVQTGVYDICSTIQLNVRKLDFLEGFKATDEYEAPVCVAIKDLDGFVQDNKDRIVPTTMGMMEVYKKTYNFRQASKTI